MTEFPLSGGVAKSLTEKIDAVLNSVGEDPLHSPSTADGSLLALVVEVDVSQFYII